MVITNPNVPLHIFTPPKNHFGDSQILLVSFDQWNSLNSGGYMIRVSEEGVRFLSSMIAESVSRDVEKWQGSDQALMASVASRTEFIDKVAIVPPHWFNAVSSQ